MALNSKNPIATETKVISCRAAIISQFSQPFQVEDIQVMPPNVGEVRIKMMAVGLSRRDILVSQGFFTEQQLPYVAGHEGSGVVESIGPGVVDLVVGDHVLTSFLPQCNKCTTCLDTDFKSNFCLDVDRQVKSDSQLVRNVSLDGTTRFMFEGAPLFHSMGCSSLSQYTVIPTNSCIRLGKDISLHTSFLLAGSFSAGFGAATIMVNLKPADTVGIVGMGVMGLACLMGCKEKGVIQIYACDANQNRKKITVDTGCSAFININGKSKSLQSAILGLTDGIGADYMFVCTDSTDSMV